MEVSMNNINHYSEKLSTIQAITDDKILLPGSMPVNVYLQEAENLYNWCRADKEKLTANGLNWSLVEDMPARIDTLREAQARWVTSDSYDIEIEKQWDEKSPAAHEFRKDLVRSMKFVFRNNPAVLSKMNKLNEGDSSAAMIQALRDISVFGKEHIDLLQAGNFDVTKLDRAADMSREMASLLGAVNSKRAFCSDTLRIRNQAYTYLREAVTEIKNHANFIFWHDTARLRGYTSEYYRKKYMKKKNQKVQEETEQITL
jgi:hypothetical protein